MLDATWVSDPRLSSNARTLYAILATFADIRTRETNRRKPYRAVLAEMLGKSTDTVDRALKELKAYGVVTVTEQFDRTGKARDASIYTLHDAEKWAGQWQQPSQDDPPEPEGSRIHAATAKSDKPQGRGRIHAARGGRAGAARVAAPARPYKQREEPREEDLEKNAIPSSRRDSHPGRRARGGGRPAALEDTSASKPATRATAKPARPHLAAANMRVVIEALPDNLAVMLPERLPVTLTRAIERGLEHRTATQVVARVQRRWIDFRFAADLAAGELRKPVGVAIELVRPTDCPDPMCEDGTRLDCGKPCERCEDHRARRTNLTATAPAGTPEDHHDHPEG